MTDFVAMETAGQGTGMTPSAESSQIGIAEDHWIKG
jgi:hypothetical protein